MTLQPLLQASPTIQVHAIAAMTAFVLEAIQLVAAKGTLPHRTLGWIWVALMVTISGTSFFIHQIKMWGDWSPIHLLSIFTLALLFRGVAFARNHQIRRHAIVMTTLYVCSLILAGAFTFYPGRIMHAVVFGP